ncbi:hypothetical protein D7Y15_13360 [Corallococcus sp. AB030]|nr:hypothetical protein D7Y15_13360 [Corallococcus sp. AB030]
MLALALTSVWYLSPWYSFSVGRTCAQPLRSPFIHGRSWWVGWTDARLIRLHIASATGIGPTQPGPTSDWEVKFLSRRHSTSWTYQLPWKRQLSFSLDPHPERGSADATRLIVEFPALLLVLLAWVAVVRASKQPDAQASPESEA